MVEAQNRSAGQRAPKGQGVALADKVAFLRRPDAYPDAPSRVDAVETHMSWVFLTERFAHKLKKPVYYEFLDFRSLDARRRSCHDEVRLNRRLAPKVYIAAVPLVLGADGALHIDGKGEIVDWLVRMHRLPSEQMLDRAILSGTASADNLRAVARLLAGFFASADRVAISPSEFRSRLAGAIAQNRQELESPDFGLPTAAVGPVCDRLARILVDKAPLFDRRVRDGCVVEGHGDLRPEHIHLGPEPAIIDCLEFNRDFRILDWADELAYLAMECERLGSPGAGEEILEACCRGLDDDPPPALIDFYKSHRALLRARLAILHLRDEHVRDPEKWRPRTMEYLQLAGSYADRLR